MITPSPNPIVTVSPGPSPQTVVLTGSGYTLSFTLPQIVSGGGSMTAQLSASPPPNVKAPQGLARKPDAVGVPLSALVYLVVTPSANITFGQAPSFTYTLPQGTTIPSGGSAYIAYWDPAQSATGWITLLGPGGVSGQTVTFPAVPQNVALAGGSTYVYALITTTGASPSPIPTATPTATPTPTPTPTAPPNTVPLQIVNNNPAIPSSSLNIYIEGQVPGSSPTVWQYVTASGSTVPMTNNGANIPPIPFGSGTTSNTLYLPAMTSGRIYIVAGTFNFNIPSSAPAKNGPNNPAPWTNDGSQSEYFDFVEYTWNPPAAMNVDTTQVDSFNLALTMKLVGAGTSTSGFLSGAVTQLHNNMQLAGGQWASLNAQWPYRVMNPGHGDQPGFFSSTTFLDSALRTAWDSYQSQWMTLDLTAAGFSTYYGQVDANENFNFYSSQSVNPANLVGTILSPFSTSNQTTYSWKSPTMQVLANNGAFVTVPSGQNATLVGAIGDRVVGALNRGTFATLAQPACGVAQYPGVAYQNQYANYLHTIASQPAYGFNGAYAFAFDDSCSSSTLIKQPAPSLLTVTINPS